MVAYTFREGDTLDGIALRNGLSGWRDIWDDASNRALRDRRLGHTWRLRPGDVLEVPRSASLLTRFSVATGLSHLFQMRAPAAVRLVDDGGHPSTAAATVLRNVQISTRVTTSALPAGWLAVSSDRRNFKIEVVDPGESGARIPADRVVLEIRGVKPARLELTGATTVEALAQDNRIDEPSAIREDPRNASLFGEDPERSNLPSGSTVWLPFDRYPRAFATPRELGVELKRVPGTNVFRSKYLRLVVDRVDANAKPQQTLRAASDGSDRTVEILGQLVRVRYTAASGEIIAASATVGVDPLRVRLAIHVLRDVPGQAPIIPLDDVRVRVQRWFRGRLAQAGISPKLEVLQAVDPVENLLCIGDQTGARAGGQGVIEVQLALIDRFNRDNMTMLPSASHTTAHHDTPMTTALALAARIREVASAAGVTDLWVETVQNPPAAGTSHTRGSVDVFVNSNRFDVIMEIVTNGDAAQRASIGRVDVVQLRGMGFHGRQDWNTGTTQQRALIRAYRRFQNRIDVFVFHQFETNHDLGQALTHGSWTTRTSIPEVGNTVFIGQEGMDASTDNPYALAHEVVHVLLDAVHANASTQLMRGTVLSQVAAGADAGPVTGSKRISAEPAGFTAPHTALRQLERIRTRGADLLVPFDINNP